VCSTSLSHESLMSDLSLSLFVSLCISLSLFVSLCISLSLFVSLCISLSLFVSLCISLSLFVSLCIVSFGGVRVSQVFVYISTNRSLLSICKFFWPEYRSLFEEYESLRSLYLSLCCGLVCLHSRPFCRISSLL